MPEVINIEKVLAIIRRTDRQNKSALKNASLWEADKFKL